MISIYILKANTLNADALMSEPSLFPFGEKEKSRLLAINNSSYRLESLGGLTALERLGRISGYDGKLEIVRDISGKPRFAENGAPSFGISHSRGVSAAAICKDGELGFDIEVIDESYDTDGIAKRFFTKEEQDRLSISEDKVSDFFLLWTAKEARAKLSGKGLSALISHNDTVSDIHEWGNLIELDGRRIAIALCSYKKIDNVKIYIYGEEDNGRQELQNRT